MNLDFNELLSNETKESLIKSLLLGSTKKESTSPFVGRKVMIRTYSAGVHFGTLVSKQGQNVVLKDAHRVHYWVKACSLSQLAMEGDKDMDKARISMAVKEIELDQCIEVIPLGEGVFEQLTSNIWKK